MTLARVKLSAVRFGDVAVFYCCSAAL